MANHIKKLKEKTANLLDLKIEKEKI